MDGSRFDGWAKAIGSGRASRHALLRLVAGAGVAAVLGAAEPAAARSCRRNGRPCLPVSTGNCCSGYCERTGRMVGRCRARAAAKGCTIRDNSCSSRNGSQGVACRDNANGRCFLLRNGRPFCATQAACFNCSTNDDCNRRFRRTDGRCTTCDSCTRDRRGFCIFP